MEIIHRSQTFVPPESVAEIQLPDKPTSVTAFGSWAQEREYVLTPDGMFPEGLTGSVRYKRLPQLSVTVGVREGQPSVTTIESPPGGPRVNASMVRRLPEPFFHCAISAAFGHMARYGPPEYRERASEAASAADLASKGRRGRTVDLDTLKLVAEIVRRNRRNPRRKVCDTLHCSESTGTRYIKKARQMGLLDTDA